MVMNPKDRLATELLLKDCKSIERMVRDVSFEDFKLDDLLAPAICLHLSKISYNVSKLNNNFKNQSKEIRWKVLERIGDMLINQGDNVDKEKLFYIASIDIPKIHKTLEEAL